MAAALGLGALVACLVGLGGCAQDDAEPRFSPATPYTPPPEGEPPTGNLRRRDRGPRPDQDVADLALRADQGAPDVALVPDSGPDAASDVGPPDAGFPPCVADGDCRFAVSLDDCSACPVTVTAAELEATDCLAAYDPLRPLEAYAPLECGAPCRAQAEQFCLRPLGVPACGREGRCFERDLR